MTVIQLGSGKGGNGDNRDTRQDLHTKTPPVELRKQSQQRSDIVYISSQLTLWQASVPKRKPLIAISIEFQLVQGMEEGGNMVNDTALGDKTLKL